MHTKKGTISNAEFTTRLKTLIQEYNGDYPDTILLLATNSERSCITVLTHGKSANLGELLCLWQDRDPEILEFVAFSTKIVKREKRKETIRTLLGKLISPFIRVE